MPARLPPPAVEGGVEFQNLLGHLEPLPFQSVIQSVDFVDVHQAAGAGDNFGHHFLAGGPPSAVSSVELATHPPPVPPAKTQPRQATVRQVQPKNTVEHKAAPLVTNYKLPDQWQKVMVTKKLGDGTEKNTIFLYPPGCPKEQKLKNNDELIRYTEILSLLLFYRYASNEAGLAQEIREISFEHLLLYTISVAYGHWASTTSATALGVHSPSVELNF